MIVDLVSPWCAAVDAADAPRACTTFRTRHAPMLETLRRARTPLSPALPLADDPPLLRQLAHRAADPATQQQIRDLTVRAAEIGAAACQRVVLVAGDGTGDEAEPIPWPSADAVLFLDRIPDDRRMHIALSRALAALTRWTVAGSRTTMEHDLQHGWDRWRSAQSVPLREWIYTEGIGLHLAQAVQPDIPPHTLLGITPAAFGRLRQRERVFRTLLAADLDQTGIGLLLRWLTPGAPAGPRTVGVAILPSMAGQYLAWRMIADRVARAGLRETILMEA